MSARTYGSDGAPLRPSTRYLDESSYPSRDLHGPADPCTYWDDPEVWQGPYAGVSHLGPGLQEIALPPARSRPASRRTRRNVGRELSRSPLLLRATLVVGLLTAASVSVIRANAPAAADNSLALGPRTAPVAAADAASPVQSCRVQHSVTSRDADRFTAVLTVANTGRSPVQRWTLRWTYPRTSPQSMPRLSDGWNATVTTDGAGGQAIDMEPGRAIPAGGSTTIGFVGTGPGTAPSPSNFTLNGVTCR